MPKLYGLCCTVDWDCFLSSWWVANPADKLGLRKRMRFGRHVAGVVGAVVLAERVSVAGASAIFWRNSWRHMGHLP